MPSTWPAARPPPSTIRPRSTGECSNIRPPQRKRPPGRKPPTVWPIKQGSKFDELLDRARRHGSPAGGLSTFCAQVGGLGHHRVSDSLRPAHLQTADTGAIIKSASAARPLMKRQQPLCRCDTLERSTDPRHRRRSHTTLAGCRWCGCGAFHPATSQVWRT
jgi:hypothetical protein